MALASVALLAGLTARSRRPGVAPAAMLAAALGLGLLIGARGFWGGSAAGLDLSSWTAFPFALALDRLSSFFLVLLCTVGLPVTLYCTSYLPRHYDAARAQWIWALLPLFVLSMVLVLLAATAFAFLIAWELMTLTSAALILVEGASEQRRHDVFIYLVMMHAGAAAVIAAFLLFLPYSGGLSFSQMRLAGMLLPAGMREAIFLAAFVGFSAKAGIIPLHLWLPRAHPIAPTPVSALMSAVMLKTAVYGFIRINFDLLGRGPDWGGYLVLIAGAVSGVLGALYALGERDLKRLLAYSSVENIGIIYLGLGAAMIGSPLAMVAALLHTLNHALFKSLLFLGSGAISDATHTLNLENLGGLFKRMPATALAFLVGCVSIAALPLSNGFVSEWLTFQSLLQGPAGAYPRLILPLSAGVLALIGGLAASCVVNMFGVAFLGRPRTAEAAHAREVPAPMVWSLRILAGTCVVLGIFPQVVLSPLAALLDELMPGRAVPLELLTLPRVLGWTAFAVLGALAIALGVRATRRIAPTWACGLPGLTERHQYSFAAFSKPLRFVFSQVYRPDRRLEVVPARQPYFPASISYQSVRTTSYERGLYQPLAGSLVGLAQQLRRLQSGNIQLYLLYIFLTLVVLLAALGVRR